MKKHWFITVLMSHLGRPYIWAGDDFSGFDCSGLTIEALKAVGEFPLNSDDTANGLWTRFKSNVVLAPTEGCLLFWSNNEGKATHVAVALDAEHCITADGGGSKTITLQDAIDQNAFIKIRRIDHRHKQPKIVNIFE